MYLSAKVKMVEHAYNIVKGIFQISKIILPNPEIFCFYIMFYRALKADNWSAAIFFSFFLLKLRCVYFPLAGKGSSSNAKGWELPL